MAATPSPADGALPIATAGGRSPGMSLPIDQSTGSAAGIPGSAAAPQKTPDESENDIRSQAFGAALTGLLPLRPPEIRKVLEHYDETRQAVTTPIYPDPTPKIVAQTLSLDPGTTPIEIKVATGNVTTVTMLDSTGEPWPIQDLTWAGNFEIVAATEKGGGGSGGGSDNASTNNLGLGSVNPLSPANIIRITPLAEFVEGNISIRMVGLKTAVTFTLRSHRDEVWYRFDARIPQQGPFAKASLIQGGLSGGGLQAGDAISNSILDGIPPEGSERLTVTGIDSRTSAYRAAGKTYVRTPLTLLSPGWNSSVSSADGTNVYAIANAPVLLLSDKGNVVQAHLTGHGDNKSSVDGGTAQ